ncbi:FAD-dependent oxidoreductase [Pseudenhygromyxa sp. WMMC2535]|uniref:NAD(P)/FAD-dependent oxidoreductase n=1 Tax=Pseudenhygromyxa sp. WMMC2535 TaxID=2712867 RepID=UPI00155165D0|nr:FAD-dependent oxidoreductase [Pseudenhygromyxa sp. WMMC2535]NVB40982.1 FAD-dependent oxidoreductase [Pseudenhygromyxa sp. WMMC2535]
MSADERVVIVGAGQAGAELATSLRQRRYAGRITMIGEEAVPPYQRPPLSKGFLLGQLEREALYLKPAETYARFDIELRLGTRVAAIDPESRAVVLGSGERLGYDKLALATGGRARRLDIPGVELDRLDNLFVLRGLADAKALREAFAPGRHLVLVGGGYVGLEIAAVAVQLGLRATVVEAAPRILARVTGPEVSDFMAAVHRAHGVELRLASVLRTLVLDDAGRRITGVRLGSEAGSETLDADLVLLGVGLEPNVELAASAGLAVDDGVLVDAFAQTSDPDILAIGDCARGPNAHVDARIRLESVPNAIEQAKVAAATILGEPRASTAVPWFWSEQYGLELQTVGLLAGYDRCITRSPAEGCFEAFYLAEDRLIAADVIGRPADFMQARRLVAARSQVDPDRLAQVDVPLAKVAI